MEARQNCEIRRGSLTFNLFFFTVAWILLAIASAPSASLRPQQFSGAQIQPQIAQSTNYSR